MPQDLRAEARSSLLSFKRRCAHRSTPTQMLAACLFGLFAATQAAADTPQAVFDLEARRVAHWAWHAPQTAEMPAIRRADWLASPIDAFVLARLERHGLQPATMADRRILIRRLYFDIVGLPPPPTEIAAFLADQSPNAWERIVDRLLSSPHFGERWARHWLDLVRYAETRGHEFDYDIPNAYQYRDYVIRAVNADVSYDQFVLEHVAGDLVQSPRRHPSEGFNESILATGFWFLGEWVHSPVDIRQDEVDRFDNMIDVFSKTFLGLTVACARCHDHKFDAIAQRDYYALAGYLQSSEYRQVRFETHDQHQQIARELEALRRTTRAELARRLIERERPALTRMSEYLATAFELAAAPSERGAAREQQQLEDYARQRNLLSEILASWISQLQAAAEDPSDLLHALGHRTKTEEIAGDADVTPQHSNEVAGLPKSSQAAIDDGGEFVVVVDYSKCREADFFTDGFAFGLEPDPVGRLVLGKMDQRPLIGVRTYGAARSDGFWSGIKLSEEAPKEPGRLSEWTRAGRTFRTPTFEIRPGKVYYLVRGAGVTFAVVNSHRMIQGPLHGETLKSWAVEGERPQWIEHDLSTYLGHDAHLEFTVLDDKPLEVLAVVQAPAAPADGRLHDARMRHEPSSNAERRSPIELASQYAERFNAAADLLASSQLERSETSHRLAPYADLLVRKPELFGAGDIADDMQSQRIMQNYRKRLDALQAAVRQTSQCAPAMWDGPGWNAALLVRGDHRTPGDRVPRGVLTALASVSRPTTTQGSGRLGLAQHLIDPHHPLTARVFVNRVWQHLFGRGIVDSSDNFGALGEPPLHPELLDHLAIEFVRDEWSIKRLIRRLVLSRTYRMASVADASDEVRDPDNRWLHRMPLKRLEGEAIRDSMLAVSGRLDMSMYGPSVLTHLTEFQQGRGRPAENGPLDGLGRRSIYLSVRRNFLNPMMLAFDTPIPFTCVGSRNVSNVPAQALVLMNDPFTWDQAQLWADQALKTGDASANERIRRLYEQVFSRPPTEDEQTAALDFLTEQAAKLQLRDEQLLDNEQLWTDFCHVLLNSKEFIFIQ